MLVLLVTGGLLSLGVYGSVHIVQRFDPNRMLPQDSYLSKWIKIQQDYYTEYGFQVWVCAIEFYFINKVLCSERNIHIFLNICSQPYPSILSS